MKKIISLLLVAVLFVTGCTSENNKVEETLPGDVDIQEFDDFSDIEFLTYVEDEVYSGITDQLASEDYQVESVDAIYISQEYLDELEFNSKENIYFGYTLSELDEQYKGTRYIFTVDEDGNTVTKAFEKYDDTYEKVAKNVAIGTGVILICVTVAVATGGSAVPTEINMIFTAAAKTGASFAASSSVLSSAGAAIVTGVETKDVEETMKAATLAGSESFKWGAITGVIAGGTIKGLELIKSGRIQPKPSQSEKTVLDRAKGNKREQIAYKDGKEVRYTTEGSTRPDVCIENADGTLHAIEVKNYNLASPNNRSELYRVLERQITSRVKNLPKGSTQEVVLDVRGRHFPKETVKKVVSEIQSRCASVYPDLKVTVMAH